MGYIEQIFIYLEYVALRLQYFIYQLNYFVPCLYIWYVLSERVSDCCLMPTVRRYRHVAPLGHIILIPTQPVFALSP
jgi:hypothetical protein